MPASDETPLLPVPTRGRVHVVERRVELGDASPGGRLRLDGLARVLQDVSNDDTRDVARSRAAAVDGDETSPAVWVIRRTLVQVERFGTYGELLRCVTFCSGTGRAWAERRVSITGDRGAAIEALTLWVHLDPVSGRPSPLPDSFHATYGEAAAGRTVRARLHLPDPPPDAPSEVWPLRFADFDVMDHLNNASYWVVVEEHLAHRRDLRAPLRAAVEFRSAVEHRHDVGVVSSDEPDALAMWLVGGQGVFAAARVERLAQPIS
ncbi:MAG TPA: acyl-ACP thioesterase domain-containing protein [Acidimicrobiales bacterium]